MKDREWRACAVVIVAVLLPLASRSQETVRSFAFNGIEGKIPVTQMSGRRYVDVEDLARLFKGSLSFSGDQVTLTSASRHSTGATPASPDSHKTFSKPFLRAGIEAMSEIREWHSAFASAIANQHPLDQAGMAPLEARAMTSVRLAQAAAETDADQSGSRLIANVYEKMKSLNAQYLAKRASLTYIAPDSLANDALDRSIVDCGRSLGAMAASGQFTDQHACH
jgi:hypothetical protein